LSADESNDEVTNKRRYPEFNATTDTANPYFQIGMVFDSFKAFKEAVIEYAIKERKNIRFERNDTTRVKAVCKKDCMWSIWVSRLRNETENVQVKTFNSSHTCVNEHNIKFLTVNWLVSKYLLTFRAESDMILARSYISSS
jgi:MuDR family transposase